MRWPSGTFTRLHAYCVHIVSLFGQYLNTSCCSEYFDYSDTAIEEQPLYLFDKQFASKAPQLAGHSLNSLNLPSVLNLLSILDFFSQFSHLSHLPSPKRRDSGAGTHLVCLAKTQLVVGTYVAPIAHHSQWNIVRL